MNIKHIRSSNEMSYLSQNGINKGHCQEINKTYGKFPMDGVFDGFWTAYQISVFVGNKTYLFETFDGIKGIKIPVKLTVKKGYIVDFELK